MAEIRAFRAVRPAAAYAKEIAALPYDVYDEAEARRAVAGKPLSFLCIDRAETQLPEGTDPYSPVVYEKAAALFEKEERDGYFEQEKTDCYYVYSLRMNGRVQTGLVACTAVSDYLNGICRKHENTVVKKEQDRIRHVKALKAQTGPIFLAYHADPEISRWIRETMENRPLYDFTADDGVQHTVWRIADAARIREITERFARHVPCTYIADGHHRAASAVKAALELREKAQQGNAMHGGQSGDGDKAEQTGRSARMMEYDYFLSVLFPDDELEIMDYNRVVRDLNGLSAEAFLKRSSECFDIRKLRKDELDKKAGVPLEKPREKGVFHVYPAAEGSWYEFRLREEERKKREKDPVQCLDVSALQELLLTPVLGIGDPRTDERIEFVGGIRGIRILREKADSCGGVAFSMHPTAIGELMAVADAGRLMPPKSTWFEPKLRSGLFIHKIGE